MSTQALDFSSFADEEDTKQSLPQEEQNNEEDFDTKVMEAMKRQQEKEEEETRAKQQEALSEKEKQLLAQISEIQAQEDARRLEKRIEEVVNEVPDETLELLKTLSADYGDAFSQKMLFEVTDIEGFSHYVTTEEGKHKLNDKLFEGTSREMWDLAQESEQIRDYINKKVDHNLSDFCSSFEKMAKVPKDDVDRFAEEYPIENEAFAESSDAGSMSRDQYLRYLGRQNGTLFM